MRELHLLRLALLSCSLLGAACADSTAPDGPKTVDEDPAGDGSDSPDDKEPLDAGKTPARDASMKPPVRDAGDASQSQQATPDGGIKAGLDAGRTDGGSPVPSARPKPKCMKKDSQLIMVGDSYQNWVSHTFPQDMAKAAGQTWRLEAVGGYSMATGGLGLIPPEFDNSIARDPDAHTVLLDGGGNDILLADITIDPLHACQTTGSSTMASCKLIVSKAIDAATALVDRGVKAGIRDVVYFFYPHVPANTLISGPNPNEILDYALPLVKNFCDTREAATGGKLRCTFIDLVPVFEGHMDWFNTDIHPNSTGSAAMAKKVWQVMTDNCIAQKSGAGCCEE